MAYVKPTDLDGFITQMGKSDVRIKTILSEDLVNYLSDYENSLVCTDLGMLIDALMPWLTGSHFKIAQRALEAFTELVQRLGQDFNAYTSNILPHVVDRLGDSRDTVREKAQLLLQKLIECRVVAPQKLLDSLTGCFKHKNAKIREEFLQTIVNTLNEYGTHAISVKAFISPIVALLGDPTAVVRDAAFQTLVEIYKHVGDRLRQDLRKKDISPQKLATLEQKFDEVKHDGLLLASALNAALTNYDEADAASLGPPLRPTKLVKRTMSATASARKHGVNDTPTNIGSGENMSLQAGAVTQEIFEASFENVPQITVFGQRDIDEAMKTINVTIGDKNMDWEKRVDALKKLRSLLMLNAQTNPNFPQQLKDLSISFLDILKELRSQVIREACITLAYMSKLLRNKLDQFLVYILHEMINLIQNSAKIISSAGTLALRYVIRFSHIPKLLPIITSNLMQSKSKDIRSNLCELLNMVFEEWPTRALEKHQLLLRDSVKKGISDADAEARRHSRRSYWSFRKHFPDLADQLYGSLDISTQKQVEKERDAGSNASNFRSVSAVDANAVQRAKARAQYANMSRLKMAAGSASVPRVKKITSVTATPQQSSPERQVRSRQAGVSQSQPSSRSSSPSSRLHHYTPGYSGYRQTGTVPKKATTGIPRSLVNSRETSPSRGQSQFGSLNRRQLHSTSSPRRAERPPLNPGRQSSAQKMLQQSREAESTLSPDEQDFQNDLARLTLTRKISREESDDGSEASSVCSERSFDSYRRGNDSYSWNGSRSRLDGSAKQIDDIDTIIQYCASTHWSERKDGLTNMTQYLSEGKMLTAQQLQCILDLFRKMFMDPHIKVYSLFLDTVNELILSHSNDLHDWLFILLTRLFNKLGTDLLGSMHDKVWKTLRLIYEYFPANLQLQSVFKILTDSTQTPNVKTKYASVKFLTTLAQQYCMADNFMTTPPVDRAILKVLTYTADQKSMELKQQSRHCIIALYNLNPANMTLILANLPKQYQDQARTYISTPLRNNVSGPRSRQTSVEVDHSSINHEEVYKNLRKTTAEIQNYTFESKLDRNANSKDSGISQMGENHLLHAPANGFNGHIGSIDKDDSINGSKTQSSATTESNTPENTVKLENMGQKVAPIFTIDKNEIVLENGIRESEIIKQAVALAHIENADTDYIVQVFLNLTTCIANGTCDLPKKYFKQIMITLLKMIESQNPVVMIAALKILSKIIRSSPMREDWTGFLELILLKIIDCYKAGKEVQREIDSIIGKISAVLPVDTSINILNPVIATGDFPSNLCALKILRDLADQQGKDFTDNHLDILMPNIARLADVEESMVRKAAVFCIVKLYFVMGEEKVKPKFALLNASKVRLLNVYISKNQGKNSSS
ncbi:CLUMA_CG020652, isoform B [Clunio marinus]|uniref:CLUMA_CG020652, isoform B n=1 Tax=Clunio marinus TaxID=568069 RepID=A0A1J1J5L4_9DIPT|nr:CLUMA_CG020652, isoform B [Clunio marinus]